MLHNQVAINVSTTIHAKGTTKSNVELTSSIALVLSNLMVRVNIDLMCRKWRAKENKLQSDGT